MMRFNEGKACDAVVRHIEARERSLRSDPSFPEADNHPAPVEFTCSIAGRIFAFEHTGIEPFEQHLEWEVKAQAHLDPIRTRLAAVLPKTEHFVLHLPAKATFGLKQRELGRIQDAIVVWATKIAPTLPVARFDRLIFDTKYESIPGVPFKAALHRVVRGGPHGQLSVVYLVIERSMEEERASRIHRAYNKKLPKLAAWRNLGARTVLIFEHCDAQLTTAQRVADALVKIEQVAAEKPDEIYLLDSSMEERWWLCVIRMDSCSYFNRPTLCSTEIDSALLNDLTKR